MTRLLGVAIAVGLLLAISGTSSGARQSRHLSGAHAQASVKEDRWYRILSVARASIRSQGQFGLSVWPGNQLPLSGPPLWRPR